MAEKDSVRVAVRLRPLSDYERIRDQSLCIHAEPNENQIRAGLNASYTFDSVFGPECSQADIYEECCSDLLNAVFEGFNATILAYGQTGSGKTFTMGSSADQILAEETAGIIPRFIKNLFHMIAQKEEEDPNNAFKVYVQFLEIYGEDIRDLLDQTRTSKVVIRETRNGEVFLTGAREELVSSFEQMMKALEDGTRNRTTSSTKMNLTSSRSHAIFTVNMEHIIYSEVVKDSAPDSLEAGESETKKGRIDATPLTNREVRKSKFHFVDLAGSERVKRTGAEGTRLKEGIDINKGLLALGNVISALGDEIKRGKVHVPYRDSKLTRMLRDSLGGNSKTLMICCVSPAAVNYNESLNALRYANRARNIKNKPIINRDPTLIVIDQLRSTLKVVAIELLEIRKRKEYVELDARLTDPILEQLAAGSDDPNVIALLGAAAAPPSSGRRSLTSAGDSSPVKMSGSAVNPSSSAATSLEVKRMKDTISQRDTQLAEMKRKLNDGDFEVKRLTDLLKLARQQASELSDQMLLAKSEADYYRLKWAEIAPPEETAFLREIGETISSRDISAAAEELSPILREKTEFISLVAHLKKEIDSLRKDLAAEQANAARQRESLEAEPDGLLDEGDSDFTSTIATLIAQTRNHLQEESRKLKKDATETSVATNAGGGRSSSSNSTGIKKSEMSGKGEGGSNTNSGNNTPGNPANANNNSNLASTSGDDIDMTEEEREERALKEDGENNSNNEVSAAEEIELEREYARRQRMLSTEVQELGQSILLKEQLLAQLVKSQEQYSRMKTFYEQRLQALSSAMQEKQNEREKLLLELQEIADKNSEAEVIKSRETKLREELRNKDEELKLMKKKQQELRNLAQAQTQYTLQLTRLETDIVSMKKQRVDLTKQLQTEKRNHMAALTEKAREIDRLKKELLKASSEVKRLGKASETAEMKMKEAMKEGAILRRRASDFARLHEAASATNTRLALKAISTATIKQKTVGKKAVTEDEIRARKWINQRVAEISTKEAVIENLKIQYEQQLELLQRKEELEGEKAALTNKIARHSSSSQSSRAKEEDEKLMEILEDRLSTLTGQLNAKVQRISDLRAQVNNAGDLLNADKVTELLRKQIQTLPASHEMIRMLLELLIQAQKATKMMKEQSEELNEKESVYQQKMDELHKQLASERRAYDMEITGLTKEYEEKYQNLFQHITLVDGFHSMVPSMGHLHNGHMSHPSAATSPMNSSISSTAATAGGEYSNLNSPNMASASSPMRREASFDPIQMQLSISAEENKFLKTQLDREAVKYSQMQTKFNELDKIKTGLVRDISEKNNTIRFLEEERSLFKAMAEEMKAALHNLGKDGKLLVQSIKGKAPRASRPHGLFNEYLNSDSEDESQSVLGEFDSLVDEINRTGNVSTLLGLDHGLSLPSSTSTSSFMNGYYPGGSGSSGVTVAGKGESIVERLTNPSNFTGSIKTVFKEDLATKRMKTQQIRNQEKQGAHNSRREGFLVTTGNSGISSGGNSSGAGGNGYYNSQGYSGNNNGSNAPIITPLSSARDSSKRFFADNVSSSVDAETSSSSNRRSQRLTSSGTGNATSSTGNNNSNGSTGNGGRSSSIGGGAASTALSISTSGGGDNNADPTIENMHQNSGDATENQLSAGSSGNGNAGTSTSNSSSSSLLTSAPKGGNVFARLSTMHIASSYNRHLLTRVGSVGAEDFKESLNVSRTMSPNVRSVPTANSNSNNNNGNSNANNNHSNSSGGNNQTESSNNSPPPPVPSSIASSSSSLSPPPPPTSITVNGKVITILNTAPGTGSSRPSSEERKRIYASNTNGSNNASPKHNANKTSLMQRNNSRDPAEMSAAAAAAASASMKTLSPTSSALRLTTATVEGKDDSA